jgi:hypothetical protein
MSTEGKHTLSRRRFIGAGGTVNRMMLRLPGGTSRPLPPRAAVATGSRRRPTRRACPYGFEQLLARLAEIGYLQRVRLMRQPQAHALVPRPATLAWLA